MAVLSLASFPERKAFGSGQTGPLRLALVISAAGARVEDARPPVACGLVLDVSGSMEGPALEHLIQSVERLCDIAQPSDQLAMVAFSDSASVVSPPTTMDPAGRRLLQSRARRLRAEGGTNMEDGVRKAAALLDAAAPGARKTLLVLSDGQPNRGAASPEQLAAVTSTFRPNLTVSTLGYGAAHADEVMLAIADAGAGKYQFIADPVSCRRDLAAALGAQGDIVAGAIECAFIPAPGVEIRRFIGTPTVRYADGAVTVPQSDMEDQSQRIVALELFVTRPLAPNGKLVDVRLRFREAAADTAREVCASVHVDVTADHGPEDPEALTHLFLARAEEVRREARSHADRGNFAGAAAVVRALLREIEGSRAYVANDGSPLSEAHELLLDEAIAFERNPSAESYSVFKKHTMSSRLDQDGARSVRPKQGEQSRHYTLTTTGRMKEAYLVVVAGPVAKGAHRLTDNCAIGRTTGADIVLGSPQISRRHADVYALESEYWICDLGSTNTTRVNGKALTTAPHKLAQGDLVTIGDVELRFVLGAPGVGPLNP